MQVLIRQPPLPPCHVNTLAGIWERSVKEPGERPQAHREGTGRVQRDAERLQSPTLSLFGINTTNNKKYKNKCSSTNSAKNVQPLASASERAIEVQTSHRSHVQGRKVCTLDANAFLSFLLKDT